MSRGCWTDTEKATKRIELAVCTEKVYKDIRKIVQLQRLTPWPTINPEMRLVCLRTLSSPGKAWSRTERRDWGEGPDGSNGKVDGANLRALRTSGWSGWGREWSEWSDRRHSGQGGSCLELIPSFHGSMGYGTKFIVTSFVADHFRYSKRTLVYTHVIFLSIYSFKI